MAFTVVDAYHLVAIFSILLGFLACFFGYKLIRFLLALVGFVLFLTFGFVVVYYFISPNVIAAVAVGSVIAIFGAVFMSYFPAFGAFMLGLLFGGFFSTVLISLIHSDCILRYYFHVVIFFSCFQFLL